MESEDDSQGTANRISHRLGGRTTGAQEISRGQHKGNFGVTTCAPLFYTSALIKRSNDSLLLWPKNGTQAMSYDH